MHDIGALIWIALVLIGVISSIRRNVQRARAAQQTPVRPPPPPVVRPAVQIAPAAPPVQAYVMPPVPPPAQAAPPAPVPPPAFPTATHVGTPPIRGMFGGSATLVRAIVAAEVLGPPIALQERSIWSPRHSEPSI